MIGMGSEAEGKFDAFRPHMAKLHLCSEKSNLEIFEGYVKQLLSVTSPCDAAGEWIDHARPMTMLEDNLLLASVSSFGFQENVVVLSPNTARCFVGVAAFEMRGKKVSLVGERAKCH